MPLYRYEGIRKDGSTIRGDYFCADLVTLKNDLAKEQVRLVKYSILKSRNFSRIFSLGGNVSMKEFVQFATQLAIMIRSGTSIAQSFNILRNQQFSVYFKNVLSNVYEDVMTGTYLSKALEKYPAVFPSFFTSMVYVGELSGNLPEVLDRSVVYYENNQKMKKKAKSALIYPTFLFTIVILVFLLLMIFVVPQFIDMINSFEGKVPAITQGVANLSAFVKDNVIAIVATLLGLVLFLFIFFKKTKAGKHAKDWLGYHAPVFKSITKNTITTRYCNGFSILLASGMNVIDCMSAMPKIVDNHEFEKRFTYAIADVNDGVRLTTAIDKTNIFPDMVIEMTSVGEQSASLKEVYEVVGKYYEEETATSIQRATSMLEPITIIFLGIMVLIIILAIMLPMLSLMSAID